MSQPITETQPTAAQATPVAPVAPATPAPATPEPEPKPDRTFTQAELDQIIAKRLTKYADYDDVKTKAAEYDKAQDAAKSELQKAQERAEKAEAEALAAKRAAFAAEKGVPPGLVTGTTEAEWTAAVEAALAWKGTQPPATTPPASYAHALGNLGGNSPASDIDAQIAEAEKSRNFALSIQLKQKRAAMAANRT